MPSHCVRSLVPIGDATSFEVVGGQLDLDAVARAVEHAPPPPHALEGDSGTVTIVFSDIESSTQRATSMGDASWMKVLAAHNDIIKRHVDAWKGTIVKNQGDGFMLTFGGARRALRAMIDVLNSFVEA